MILYMNNNGDKWIELKGERGTKRNMPFVLVLPDGTRRLRQADYYESFGNFALTCYRYKGKRYKAFAKGSDGSDMRTPHAQGLDALPHVFHKE